MAMTEVARATVTIIPNMQGAQQKITQDLTGAAGPAGTAAGNAAGKSIASAIGNKTSAVGAALTKNITVPMLAVGTASVAAWKSVDAGMDVVAAKTGATGEALTAMQDSVKSIAATIPTSFETAGNAVGEVNTRFGLTGQALEDLSTQFIKFADLNSTDVSSSIDNVQKALSAFGLGAEDASSLLDTLNAVGQSTGVSMDSLTNGLIQNGTAFQELGLNVDQSVMLMGQLEKSGANSETVMNGLRKALKNAAADGVPLNEALSNLQDSILNGTDSMDGLTAAYDLFGKSGDQIYGAIKNGTLDFTELGAAALNAGGSVSSAFEETKSPVENFQTVLNRLMTMGANIVETVGPMLATALETISNVLDKVKVAWDSLSPGVQEGIVKAGLLVAATGPVISIIGKVIAFAPMLVSGIGTVVTALGPVGIAIAAVIAVGVLLIKHWDEIKAAAQQIWQNVVQTFETMKQSVVSKIDALKSSVREKWESIKRSITEPIEKAKETVRSAIEKIKGFFNVTLSFPHIKLPHFRITGGVIPWGIGGKGSPPSIGIDWYDKGGVFDAPTIIGVGERRPEFVGALDDLREIVREESGPTINYGGVTIVINGRGKDAAQLATELQDELERRTSLWT